jgi:hypothetical protein
MSTTSESAVTASGDRLEVADAIYRELRRTNGTWRIRKLYLEVLWAERRKDPSRYLEELGGPAVIWTRR